MPRPPTSHWLLTPTAACATQGSRVTRWLSRNRLPSSEKSQATAFASRMTNACAPGRGAADGAGFDVRIAAADDGGLFSAPARIGELPKSFGRFQPKRPSRPTLAAVSRSEEHTTELQTLMRTS